MLTPPPPAKTNTRSPVHPLIKERKEAKRGKMKVVVGSVVTAKVGEIEEKTREGRSRRMRKEVVGCGLEEIFLDSIRRWAEK